ncbi:MAG: MipA/OmpV family protein [Gammaproteobacteria bacterium]
MKIFFVLALAGACGSAAGQTPANNPMPDGSRDMYVGLGASSQPRYDGADNRRTRALPLLQFEFSNGLFVSGLSAGWHLAQGERIEYGPLLAFQPRRTPAGLGAGAGGVSAEGEGFAYGPPTLTPGVAVQTAGANRLEGMRTVRAHAQGGVFLNYYLTPQLRLTNSVLYGAGGKGLAWELGLQRIAAQFGEHHRLSASAGLTVVNRQYNETFFGVTQAEHLSSGNAPYAPDGGIKDVFVGGRWNWALSPSLMLTSSARVSRLTGDARRSPLVEQPTQFSISTGLAVRF